MQLSSPNLKNIDLYVTFDMEKRSVYKREVVNLEILHFKEDIWSYFCFFSD